MSDSKKRRMSMLDSLTAGGTPTPGSMMSNNRALRSARDAVDAHRVWELDPAQITDTRPVDRLDPADFADLRHSIEVNGQTVPILVRRDPADQDRYLLVYGARRLAAIRDSETVTKVRALIANLDDDAALRAQVSENTARRDLSFIERALFALNLLDSGFGSQVQIAEVLNATKSSVSMAISIARSIGAELAEAIGPAHGIGRPRWEALARDIDSGGLDRVALRRMATSTRVEALFSSAPADGDTLPPDPSVVAFETVARYAQRHAGPAPTPAAPRPAPSSPAATRSLTVEGHKTAVLRKTARGLTLDLSPAEPDFAAWVDDHAEALLQELHDRWKRQT
ncbi:MAG: plasmid partitioning protein RepB [Rhodobacteraceae bacterium]|nr:plasmid partitioning protein RepB [Paracoccaceae bacterium]